MLLHEMQIQHPTASLIARTATAQDDMTVRLARARERATTRAEAALVLFDRLAPARPVTGRRHDIRGDAHWRAAETGRALYAGGARHLSMEHKATGAARNSETIIVRRLPAVATSPPVARRRCGDGAGWGCAPTANRASSDGQCSLVSARIVLFHGSRRRRPPVVRAGRCCSALAAAVVRQGLHPRIICEGYDLARAMPAHTKGDAPCSSPTTAVLRRSHVWG